MDSFTQIALGAAVGEATLGKKVGNRAMVWGAFGGMLPDFDVFARFFTDEITALAFHRGFMHSIVFAIMAAFVLGWLVEWLYSSGTYRKKWYKGSVTFFILALFGLIVFGLYWILKLSSVLLIGGVLGLLLGGVIWVKYLSKESKDVVASKREWTMLFFLSIVTHPILDCFTAFGTQLFLPFSDTRVSWDNISVVDPLYTIPLALGVLIASFFSRNNKNRRLANWIGITVSCAYMAFTFHHKNQFEKIFLKSLAEEGIEYNRYMSSPTILQNYLWLGVAEGDTAYYHGYHTLMDDGTAIEKFSVIPKDHELIDHLKDEKSIQILKWFSKEYYNVIERRDGRLQFNDLRYGSFKEVFEDEDDYIFKFILTEKDGHLEVDESRGGREVNGKVFSDYFDRVLGRPKPFIYDGFN